MRTYRAPRIYRIGFQLLRSRHRTGNEPENAKSATSRAIVSVVENSRIAQGYHNSLARDCQLSKSVEVARPRERFFNFSFRFRGKRVTNRIPCCWIEPVEYSAIEGFRGRSKTDFRLFVQDVFLSVFSSLLVRYRG